MRFEWLNESGNGQGVGVIMKIDARLVVWGRVVGYSTRSETRGQTEV